MYQQQPDFNECSSLREAAKRAWDWAWNHPDLNPHGLTPVDAPHEQQDSIYHATLQHLVEYALQEAERKTGYIDRQQMPHDLATALHQGLHDWIHDNVAATLQNMEDRGEVQWVDGGWVTTRQLTDQEKSQGTGQDADSGAGKSPENDSTTDADKPAG